VGDKRYPLVKGQHLEVHTVEPTAAYPILSAVLTVGEVQWQLKIGSHTMRSSSTVGEPTYIFSSVFETDPDTFYCVVFKKSKSHGDVDRQHGFSGT
jgi:hypothetical protein